MFVVVALGLHTCLFNSHQDLGIFNLFFHSSPLFVSNLVHFRSGGEYSSLESSFLVVAVPHLTPNKVPHVSAWYFYLLNMALGVAVFNAFREFATVSSLFCQVVQAGFAVNLLLALFFLLKTKLKVRYASSNLNNSAVIYLFFSEMKLTGLYLLHWVVFFFSLSVLHDDKCIWRNMRKHIYDTSAETHFGSWLVCPSFCNYDTMLYYLNLLLYFSSEDW